MPDEIKQLWMKALTHCNDAIIKITDEFLQKEQIAVVVKLNIGDIFESLAPISENEKIRELRLKCRDEKSYHQVNKTLNNIWSEG